ncbi:MAG: response regulator transcription factor [Bacteroidetes bacterium]|nr:response regulator transcription factor [Bacteroidota bacterium]
MGKVNAIIIDDSPQARKLLRLMLVELASEVTILAEAENAEEGMTAIKKLNPDLIFLDIEMPGKSGIQLAEEIVQKQIALDIIFTTAYNDFAIKAFRLSAIDYLLKPLQEKQLLEAIERVCERKSMKEARVRLDSLVKNFDSSSAQNIAIPVQGGYEYLAVKDIEYLEADGSYVHLFTLDKKQKTISKNLKYFEQVLEHFPNFVRAHRSFIVNMDYVASFSRSGRGTILMKNNRSIDLARDRREYFLSKLTK